MIKKDDYYDTPNYQKFLVEKNKIKERYPKELLDLPNSYKKGTIFDDEQKKLWKQYLKELCDLMFEPNGLYQQFVWDVMSESDKQKMETKSSGKGHGNRKTEFNYY